MMYKLDPPLFDDLGRLHPDRHLTLGGLRRVVSIDGDIASQLEMISDLRPEDRVALLELLAAEVVANEMQPPSVCGKA